MLDLLFFGKARIPQTPLCPYLGHYLVCLARQARRYFADDANAAIVAEFRPLLAVQLAAPVLKGQVLLTLLLRRGVRDVDFALLREVMSVWSWVVSYYDWDLHWLVLVASFCRHTYLSHPEEWRALAPALLARVLHVTDLPVGKRQMHIYPSDDGSIASADGFPFFSLASFAILGAGKTKVLQLHHKAAKLLVYLLRPGGCDGGGSFAMLRRLIKALETYMHPSNNGYWTRRLSQLVASLCEYFAERVRRERLLPIGAYADVRLGEADVRAFAQLLLPVALQGLFSKSGSVTLQSCTALKHLSFLAPDDALQPLLERVYQALTTLTEVHQTSAALEALAAVIFPLIRAGNFDAGAKHIADLMELTLTGIDANDPHKTWATLRFLTALLSGLPLVPIPPDAPVPPGVDPARHAVARDVTDAFADWTHRFLDQTFTFIANQNTPLSAATDGGAEADGGKTDSETRTSEYFFHCTLEVFFSQLGDALFEAALGKVAHFTLTNLLEKTQQAHLGVMLGAIAAVQPARVVERIIPAVLRVLLNTPQDRELPRLRTPRTPQRRPSAAPGAVSALTGADPAPGDALPSPTWGAPGAAAAEVELAHLSEKEVRYLLNVVRFVAEAAAAPVLRLSAQLVPCIDLALLVEERPGVVSAMASKAANKLVRALCHGLLTCRPADARCVPPGRWSDRAWQARHYEDWGRVVPMGAADVAWRVPTREGLQLAADLAARYLDRPLAALQSFVAQGGASPLAAARGGAPRGEGAPAAGGGGAGRGASRGAEPRGGGGHGGAEAGRASVRFAVLQVRYVLEGMVAAMPAWDEEGGAAAESGEGWSTDEEEEGGDEGGAARRPHARGGGGEGPAAGAALGREEYASGTYELPLPGKGLLAAAFLTASGHISRRRIAQLLHDALVIVKGGMQSDSQLLKALTKAVDVVMNGVDILQKHSRRLRLRYSIMKARNREVGPDGAEKLLPRYMIVAKLHHYYLLRVMLRQRKANTLPLVRSLTVHLTALATDAHSAVRKRGQLALLSCCQRYAGMTARVLPALMALLEDKETEAAGHEQKLLGCAVLLQTRFVQAKVVRDWRLMRYFLLALCKSDHNDKETVLDALDGLFATYLSYWYQVTLDMPEYLPWRSSAASAIGIKPFEGYAELLEALVHVPDTPAGGAAVMHWRFRLMVMDAVTAMLRDDVATPLSVWAALLEGMVSDVSHLRETCYPAVASALELIQTEQRSKDPDNEDERQFPDKGCKHTAGPPPYQVRNVCSIEARLRCITPGYTASVQQQLLTFIDNADWLQHMIGYLAVVQLARPKGFMGYHAQMFKGIAKFLGACALFSTPLFAHLDSFLADAAPTAARTSSDVYLGGHCLAAEMVAGLIRGVKYWGDADRARAQEKLRGVIQRVMATPETESIGIWTAALKFSVHERHPQRVAWLTTLLLEGALPAEVEAVQSWLPICKRLMLLKPLVRELGWRSPALCKQLARDLLPHLAHPYAQMRECIGGLLAALSRAVWEPMRSPDRPTGAGEARDGGSGGGLGFVWSDAEANGDAERADGACEIMLTLVGEFSRRGTELAQRCKVAKERAAGEGGEEEEKRDRDELKHLRHTLIAWVCKVCPDYDGTYVSPCAPVLPVLLPLLLEAIEDSDQDIARQARACVELVANTPNLTRVLPAILVAVRGVAASHSYQVRSSVLPFLQVLVFRHQCTAGAREMEAVQALVVELLRDPHVQVRDAAGAAMSVLVRMRGDELAGALQPTFLGWCSEVLPPRGKRSSLGSDSPIVPARGGAKEDGGTPALHTRHAGVLGLAALIGAYPYDVPPWMPEVLVQLAGHVLDPNPISQTVRATFGEFWRTHQDAWPVLKAQFSEQQLAMLTNLLAAPTYFS